MINQLSLNQFVNYMGSLSTQESERIRQADSETANIMRVKQEVAKINRETEYIKQTSEAPPTWQTNFVSRLNIT